MSKLEHQTGVNSQGEPFVQLLIQNKDGKDEVAGQFSPKECREHAMAMLEAAEAAEQDAFLVWFVREQLGQQLDVAGQILHTFRDWREKRTGVSTGMKVIPRDPKTKGEA